MAHGGSRADRDGIMVKWHETGCHVRQPTWAWLVVGMVLLLIGWPKTSVGDDATTLRTACTHGAAPQCTALGKLLRARDTSDKREIRALYKEAAERFQQACDGGHGEGCFQWARVMALGEGMPMDEQRAEVIAAKACEMQHGEGCFYVAVGHLHGHGGGTKNHEKALAWFRKACEREFFDGCFQAGHLLIDLRDGRHDQALALLKRACDAGSGEPARDACVRLAELYRDDDGVVTMN